MSPDVDIVCGDTMQLIRGVADGSASLVLADPPYGIGYVSQTGQAVANDDGPYVWWLREAARAAADPSGLVVFCRWDVETAFRDSARWAGYRVRSQVIWDKVHHGMGNTRAEFSPQHELIIFATKGRYAFPSGRPRSVFRVPRPHHHGRTHPTEKPVELMSQLISQLTRPGDFVLDPFAGTGAAAVAAARTGRRYLGFELRPDYVQIARQRVGDELSGTGGAT